jgi:N-acetylmuramate 1-kinase
MDKRAENNTPDGLDAFLSSNGWGDANVSLLAADASFRRYFRAVGPGGKKAVIMDAPPPQEDPRPFIKVADYLRSCDLRAPEILAQDLDRGLVLIEDFGDIQMREFLDDNPDKETATYKQAIDVLAKLRANPPANVLPYDLLSYMREVRLLTDWYVPAMNLSVDLEGFGAVWTAALLPIASQQYQKTTVLRDYHAENIMLLEDGEQGIIDFQDALIGHPAYDLVSLLQDARRDVSAELEMEMLAHYASIAEMDADFAAHYALLGAQRNTKIIGIFTRLWKRDGKARYLGFLDRMWNYLERDLEHPQLLPLKNWFDMNIPTEARRRLPQGAA